MSSITSTSITNSTNKSQGWTSQPNYRGTIEILWSCIFTIFLCSWTVLCLNVPAPDESQWRRLRRKFLLAALGILGPEFGLLLSLGQWQSARRSVTEFRDAGHLDWSMTHAFFADMGGFVLQNERWPSFPLTAKQVLYLVQRGHLKYTDVAIDKRVIADKNKNDVFVRIFTIGQTIWFILNIIGRATQHLAISTLELTTVGFIVCAIPISFCWFHKPSDVGAAIVLEIDITIADLLLEAGESIASPYSRTPLDFIESSRPKQWFWLLYWSYWIGVLKKLHIHLGPRNRPLDRIPDDNFPEPSQSSMAAGMIFSFIYSGCTVGAWSYHFPSTVERNLWRASTITIPVTLGLFYSWDALIWRIIPASKRRLSQHHLHLHLHLHLHHQENQQVQTVYKVGKIRSLKRLLGKLFQGLAEQTNPDLSVPMKAVVPLTFLAMFYCVARAYILVEDLASLRCLPSSAYQTVQWSQFLPRFS
jgi:hypothetical protein